MIAENSLTSSVKSISRSRKEKLLNQHSLVIWFTGLSGSGKTTLAKNLEAKLHNQGYTTQLLDGDCIRAGLNSNLSFTEQDRKENIRRISEVSKLLINGGIITLCSFISPTEDIRELSKAIIGKESFFEVFVNAPLEVCESRDVKGLYQRARNGEIKNFTGIDSPFIAPKNFNIEIKTAELEIHESVDLIFAKVIDRIKY